MADLDSISKRRSHVHMLKPFSADIPWPTLVLGDIDQADRQHLAWLYSGILAAGAATVIFRRTLSHHGTRIGSRQAHFGA